MYRVSEIALLNSVDDVNERIKGGWVLMEVFNDKTFLVGNPAPKLSGKA